MPLVYRAILDNVDERIVSKVEPLFAAWMHSNNLVEEGFSFSHSMSAALASSPHPAWIQRKTTKLGLGQGQLHRIRLIEEQADSRWTTTALWRTPVPEQQMLEWGSQGVEQLSVFDAVPPAASSWVWVDLEHEPFGGRPIRPGSPRVVRDLMAEGEAHDGLMPLTAEAFMITRGHVRELVSYIRDPERRVPIAVFAFDSSRAYDQDRLAQRLARDLAGVAGVFRLADAAATAAFAAALPADYQVYGGALRTYLPQALTPGDAAARHRVLGRTSIATLGPRAFPAVKDQILQLSTQRPGPLDGAALRRLLAEPAAPKSGATRDRIMGGVEATLTWFGRQVTRMRRVLGEADVTPVEFTSLTTAQRELGSAIDRMLRPAASRSAVEAPTVVDPDELDTLRSLLIEGEAERILLNQLFEEAAGDADKAQRHEQEARDEADYLQLELAETTREREAGRRRIRWLEARVRALGDGAISANPDDVFDIPASVAEVLLLARSRLSHVRIGPTDGVAAELDVHPGAELFAAKTWDALTALDDYSAAVAEDRFVGNFRLWCQQQSGIGSVISANAVALVESESVDGHQQLRAKRTFPVPTEVAPEGRQYMPAHIKIVKRGSPAPRLHFHDDSRGRTGLVHVGYIGAHLPTAQFK